MTALEAAAAGNSSSTEATQRLASQAKDLRADLDAEKGELPELAGRVAKLESDAPKAKAGPDLAALAARIDKVESALAAPKNKRAPPRRSSPPLITPRRSRSSPRSRKKGCAQGRVLYPRSRPSNGSGSFRGARAVASRGQRRARQQRAGRLVHRRCAARLGRHAPPDTGSVTDRFLAHLHNLVKVRELNETAGDDPQALVSQIEAASRRGDIGAALASFESSPKRRARPLAIGRRWPARGRRRRQRFSRSARRRSGGSRAAKNREVRAAGSQAPSGARLAFEAGSRWFAC